MKRLQPFVPIIIFSGTLTLPEMVIALVDGFVSTSDDPDALLEKVSRVTDEEGRPRQLRCAIFARTKASSVPTSRTRSANPFNINTGLGHHFAFSKRGGANDGC